MSDDGARTPALQAVTEWEYGWMADPERREAMSPKGPRLMIDGRLDTPEAIARFPKGARVRRRAAGPWTPVEPEGEAS